MFFITVYKIDGRIERLNLFSRLYIKDTQSGMDIFLKKVYHLSDVWKFKDKKLKRIIWSPHHTITGYGSTLDYSTFLKYSEFMFNLAEKYRD